MTALPNPADPASLSALAALARSQQRAGRLAEAADVYRQMLAIRPDLAEVHTELGILLAQQGQLDEAATRFQHAIALRPDDAQAVCNLGALLARQGHLDEAAVRFEQAIALAPAYAEAINNLGSVLAAKGQLGEAVARFEQAIALAPDYFDAHQNLGRCAWKQGELEKAAWHFRRVIALRTDHVESHSHLGRVLRATNRIDEAIDEFQRAVALAPGNTVVETLLATCYLTQGDYERGWPAYEARLRLRRAPRQPELPRWRGEPLAGRSLLLLAEQGLGDAIQFLRYARLLKAHGARVILVVPAALGRLLASHPDVDELHLVGSAGELPAADFYLPLLSTPLALGTRVSTIPAEIPYLSADPALADRWRQELAAIEGFKIGIAWRGSPTYEADRWRSIPLAAFAPLARLDGVRLISLQKGAGADEIAAAGFPIVDLAGRLDEAAGPFMDTAAVIRNLDLVISADTAIVHLAGALGAPVFLALHISSDWRWLRDRDDSPWYPTVRLFRQRTFGDWAGVFERIAQAAGQLASLRGQAV